MRNQLGLATGNILGGIAIQTVVLVILDAFGLGKSAPLTYRAASLDLALEGVLVIAILALAVMGHQLPGSLIWHGITPDDVLICGIWIAGIYLIGKARHGLPWQSHGDAPGAQRRSLSGILISIYDQADFVPFVWLFLLPVWRMTLAQAAIAFGVVTAVHLAINVIGYAIGARTAPI